MSATTSSKAAGQDGNDHTDPLLAAAATGHVAGTCIATPAGEKRIEELREGDLVAVVTPEGRSYQPVRWVGRRKIDLVRHTRPKLAAPVRIRRGAIGHDQPRRDVLVSPDQCLFLDDRLVPARALLNGMTIVQENNEGTVHYVQLELERHSIVLAAGLPVETYLGTSPGDLGAGKPLRAWEQGACAPIVADPHTLQCLWQRYADRAEQLGFEPTQATAETDPFLHIVTAGKTVAPIERIGSRYVFVLPKGVDRVVLSSRALHGAGDRRPIGVPVVTVTLRGRGEPAVFPADHLPAGVGWCEPESGPGRLLRWTGGSGELCFDPLPEARIMDVTLAGSATYLASARPVD